jgi:hypothetical protein
VSARNRWIAGPGVLLLLAACGGAAPAAGRPLGAPVPAAEEPLPASPEDPGPATAERVAYREVALEIGVDAVHQPVLSYDPDAGYRAGGAVGDFDRDGDQDLFVLGGGLAPDRLFENQGDGTFIDRSEAWGVAVRHRGGGVAVGDVNGDGWLDLYVTSLGEPDRPPRPGAHRLYLNSAQGSFVEVAEAAGVAFTSPFVADGASAAFGDYDLDGHLDLFVAGTAPASGGNRLFRNRRDGTFEDVTVGAGVYDLSVWGFCPRFADMDGDRYPELLLVGDFGTSRYYVNQRDGTFREETVASGTGLDENGMGQAVGDFDGDGRPDWYVTSIESRHTRGNVLYRNLGGHRYEEVGGTAGVSAGAWAWGAVAFDADLDGHLDLAVANGWFIDFAGHPFTDQPTRLFLNRGALRFDEVAEACGLGHRGQGRGILDVDLEGDGDRDLVIFTHGGALEVFRDDGPPGRRFLRVFLDTRGEAGLAPDGIGTRVVATVGGRDLVRWLDGGSNYLSQGVDLLRIEWADGRIDGIPDVAANRTLVVSPAR